MIPKSNTKLKKGDYCLIPRNDGKYVPFIYICSQVKSRSYFYGSLAKVVLNKEEIDNIPKISSVQKSALLHIKCYKENNTPILGNLGDKIESCIYDELEEDALSTGIGSVTSVWGYRTIIKYANEMEI